MKYRGLYLINLRIVLYIMFRFEVSTEEVDFNGQ